jgi:hypothetical protein
MTWSPLLHRALRTTSHNAGHYTFRMSRCRFDSGKLQPIVVANGFVGRHEQCVHLAREMQLDCALDAAVNLRKQHEGLYGILGTCDTYV